MTQQSGWRRLFRLRRSVRAGVDEELAFHVAMKIEELVASGLDPATARARALQSFGGVAPVRDACIEIDERVLRRERMGDRMLGIGSILKYAYRSVRGSASTSMAVILTLALGIGVTTAVFSIVYGVLMRLLPYAESDRLVRVWLSNPLQAIDKDITSYPNFVDWRTRGRSFQGMAAVARAARNRTGAGEPRELLGAAVSEGYFHMLGVAPAAGRAFTADEERIGGPNVVILSHELWAAQLGSDPAIVGRVLSLSGEPYDVVGVMPPGLGEQDFWVPLRPSGGLAEARGALWLPVIGRLAPGVTFDQAQAEMIVIARQLEDEYPEANDGMSVLLEPLRASIVGDVRQPLLLLLGAVALVLLIACANIANVLLARGTARRTEMAVRSALGASRRQLAMQVGAESLLLAFAGGTLGVLAAYAGLQALVGLAPSSLPRLDAIRIDGSVLGVAATVTLLCGMLFGLVPALEAGGRRPAEAIRQGGRGTVGSSAAEWLRPVLVVAQFALAVMLLAGAGLMLRSFAKMQDVDPGFDPARVAVVEMNVPARKYDTNERVIAFIRGAADLPARDARRGISRRHLPVRARPALRQCFGHHPGRPASGGAGATAGFIRRGHPWLGAHGAHAPAERA